MSDSSQLVEEVEALKLDSPTSDPADETQPECSDAAGQEGGVGSSDDEYHTDEGEEQGPESKESKADIKAEERRIRSEREDLLTEEERIELRDKAQKLKDEGNTKFKQQCYTDSIEDYTTALSVCPLCYRKERAIMFSNRAAAYVYLSETENVIEDCTEAIDLHPHYPKPVLRRAQAYEKNEKLDEALEDYKKVLELDPRSIEAMQACQRLPPQINERNEKLKTEMLGKLKDIGNLVLRPFGLSTDNFNLQQNETGGYSVNFSNS